MKKTLKEFDIENILQGLSSKRPIFHNERDFQFELGMYIKDKYECEIRMEYFYGLQGTKNKRCFIDIVAFSQKADCCIAFELKYKTKKCTDEPLIYDGEEFYLKNHGAHDYGCCDVYRDIYRLESLLYNDTNSGQDFKHNPFKDFSKQVGYVIFITNDEKYYEKGFAENSIFSNFSLNANNTNKRKLKKKTVFNLGKKEIIETCAAKYIDLHNKSLNNEYTIEWNDWSRINEKNNIFKRTYIEIKKE